MSFLAKVLLRLGYVKLEDHGLEIDEDGRVILAPPMLPPPPAEFADGSIVETAEDLKVTGKWASPIAAAPMRKKRKSSKKHVAEALLDTLPGSDFGSAITIVGVPALDES